MREIKFRAWDKSKKRFFQSRDEDVSWHIPTVAGINNMIPKYATITFFDTAQNFIYSQYTGLHDENGVEVYEGDIIQGVMNYSKSKFKSNVFYNDGAFRVDTGSLICNATFEVIGNIYENKELLNG